MDVHSIDVLAVVCTTAAGFGEASLFGEATIDGAGSYKFRIDVEDHGEPGTSDTYWIILSNGHDSGKNTLDAGNVQFTRTSQPAVTGPPVAAQSQAVL